RHSTTSRRPLKQLRSTRARN
ncbi:putative mitochondrial atp synthase f1, epsilon subunit, partial [Toxoplasma gondii RUB]